MTDWAICTKGACVSTGFEIAGRGTGVASVSTGSGTSGCAAELSVGIAEAAVDWMLDGPVFSLFKLDRKNDRLRAFDHKIVAMGLVALFFEAQSMAACRDASVAKGSFAHPFIVDENNGLFWSRLNLDAAYEERRVNPERRSP